VNCPFCGEVHEISVRETFISGAIFDTTNRESEAEPPPLASLLGIVTQPRRWTADWNRTVQRTFRRLSTAVNNGMKSLRALELDCTSCDSGVKMVLVRDITNRWSKGHDMSGPGFAGVFDANLPDLARPVRINSFFDAQVFVRRWVIRDKDPAMRVLLRRMEKANSSEAVAAAIKEVKRELAVRGLLPDVQ
jgi:hypothetical protein